MLRGLLCRQHSCRDGGAVATEFALLMAFVPLTILAFGIVDYGEMTRRASNLAAVVRGAAEYARGQVVRGNALPSPADLNSVLGVPAEGFNATQFCTCA